MSTMIAGEMKLNLGCGEDYREGYMNVDFHDHVRVDKVWNLNQLPYPFSENTFSEIIASHVLEHLDNPFAVMKELHRISKKDGRVHIKVPHFSRGFTHAEHKAGFDVTFPYYFNPAFTKSGYFGVNFRLDRMRMNYSAFFHLLKYMNVNPVSVIGLKVLHHVFSFFANLAPTLCSRLWCFWVGGFEEIEFHFTAIKE
jgi:SAM-dependent methyltransferase